MIVAIDGPAGSGKSAVAKLVAEKFGFFLLNSGLYYRAVALKVLENGIELSQEDKIVELAAASDMAIQTGTFLLDGRDVGALLRSDAVDTCVATISGIRGVRLVINERMRPVAKEKDLVCEGRDVTTVVFPDAEVKIYLDASAHDRAKRRYEQGYSELSLDEIEKSIQTRDEIDKNKTFGALKIALGATYIDSSNLNLIETFDKVAKRVLEARIRS